jgi:hypothetical protein
LQSKFIYEEEFGDACCPSRERGIDSFKPSSCRINFRFLRKHRREKDAGAGAAIFKDVLNATSRHF